MYHAQDGKLFCDNPRDNKGSVEVAKCIEVNGNSPKDVAETLARALNHVMTDKSKAGEKDTHLAKVYEYIVAAGIDCVPRFIWDEINKAYQI